MPSLSDQRKYEAITRFRELKRLQWLCQFPDCDGMPHIGMPHKHARGAQRVGADFITAFITGRGYGKTRAAAEWVKDRMLADPEHRAIIVAPTFGDGRDTCIEGESGMLSVLPDDRVEQWNRSHGQLTLTNGAQAKVFSAHNKKDADRLRGPQSHTLWMEELAACHAQQQAFDNAVFGLRLGADPQMVITSTPRPSMLMRKLFSFEKHLGDRFPGLTCRIQGGSTFENESNLPLPFLAMLRSTYEHTRLGAQELEGKLLEDVLGAMFTRDMFRYADVAPEAMGRIVVAVDPPGSHRHGSEAGIIVAGRRGDQAYTFADESDLMTPEQWSSKAVELYDAYHADAIVAETNYGADLVESTIRAVDRSRHYKIKRVTATRGKALRAEPVVNLYERRLVHHVGDEGDLAALEAQMCSWVPPGQVEVDEHGIETPIPESDYSPDRLDALVWALTDLMLAPRRARTVMRMGGPA